MIKIAEYPSASQLHNLLKRPFEDSDSAKEIAASIIKRVKEGGDKAVRQITLEIDKIDLESTVVEAKEIAAAQGRISSSLKEAIAVAKANVEAFHMAQKMDDITVEIAKGVVCSQKSRPITKVGIYIPGGSAPLFSTVMMLAVPAKIAGCKEIVLCTPPSKDGSVSDEILYAAHLCGVDKIHKIGGATAIAAMAYGTESVSSCYKIFGPGNRYVTAAKQLVSLYDAAIDMPAGPSEVMVVCDNSCSPRFVATDLLSQAEHGNDSQAVAVCDSVELAQAIKAQVEELTTKLSRADFAENSLAHSSIIVVKDKEAMMEIINEYAPEHLILSIEDGDEFAERVENAGSIFIGNYTPESAGDYCSGTNHTLPTSGWAKSYSGVNLDSFCKKITYQKISKEGIDALAPSIIAMAEGEGLTAHALAAKVRTE